MPELTYQGMVEYVNNRVAPIEAHAAAHDAWHLAKFDAETKARSQTVRANISMFIAAAAVLVAAIEPAIRH